MNELTDLGLSRKNIHLVLNRSGSKKTLNVDDVAEVVGLPVSDRLSNDYSSVSDAALKGGLVPSDSTLGRELASLAHNMTGVQATSRKKPDKKWGFLSLR